MAASTDEEEELLFLIVMSEKKAEKVVCAATERGRGMLVRDVQSVDQEKDFQYFGMSSQKFVTI